MVMFVAVWFWQGSMCDYFRNNDIEKLNVFLQTPTDHVLSDYFRKVENVPRRSSTFLDVPKESSDHS